MILVPSNFRIRDFGNIERIERGELRKMKERINWRRNHMFVQKVGGN